MDFACANIPYSCCIIERRGEELRIIGGKPDGYRLRAMPGKCCEQRTSVGVPYACGTILMCRGELPTIRRKHEIINKARLFRDFDLYDSRNSILNRNPIRSRERCYSAPVRGEHRRMRKIVVADRPDFLGLPAIQIPKRSNFVGSYCEDTGAARRE